MLAILDDVFPDLTTGFRVAEYNWYLGAFPQLTVFSTNYCFEAAHTSYAAIYPEHAGRIFHYSDTSLDGCGFAFMNFLNNAALFVPELERRKIPFLFTLYPGGGFGLNDPESDTKLDSVLASPQLRGVIVTQPVTLDYLAGRVDPAIVHEINGVTINPRYFAEPNGVPVLPEAGAARICFVAQRYMDLGANKGYPEFIAAASTLAREFRNLTFAIVGSFTPDDIPLDPAVASRFHFHGRLATDQLRIFLQTQHIIISPNRPFLVSPGNFDGFPTGGCVEAALCGVTVVCSDVLNLNRAYVDSKDIVICDPTPEAITHRVRDLVVDPERLAAIGAAGRATTRRAYDPQLQLGKRVALIRSLSR